MSEVQHYLDMNERQTVVASLVAAVGLAGATSVATGQPTLFSQTPLGVAIYAFVGIAVPQHVLATRTGSDVRRGLSGIAGAGAVVALLAGYARGGVNDPWSFGFTSLMLAIVLGGLFGSVLREFWAGYRAAAVEQSR
ncbi:hypothetical protein [Haloarchaeobius sp. HRN-SO-5]|uniref:hypothetical protein n=1 Tax=Haloarchaeobius sp. HRN-SO-5 TaxID=3446118 RepID=UPI003EB94B8A